MRLMASQILTAKAYDAYDRLNKQRLWYVANHMLLITAWAQRFESAIASDVSLDIPPVTSSDILEHSEVHNMNQIMNHNSFQTEF